MYTTGHRKIFREKKEIFDFLQSGVYQVDFGLIEKVGFDDCRNSYGICLYAEPDYIVVDNSENAFSYRYKALENSAITKVEIAYVQQELLLKQITDLEDLLLIKNFKLSLQPLDASRFLSFVYWIKSKINRDNLDFFTHEDIASFLNSSRVTISRIVSSLYAQGRITKDKGRIEKVLINK